MRSTICVVCSNLDDISCPRMAGYRTRIFGLIVGAANCQRLANHGITGQMCLPCQFLIAKDTRCTASKRRARRSTRSNRPSLSGSARKGLASQTPLWDLTDPPTSSDHQRFSRRDLQLALKAMSPSPSRRPEYTANPTRWDAPGAGSHPHSGVESKTRFIRRPLPKCSQGSGIPQRETSLSILLAVWRRQGLRLLDHVNYPRSVWTFACNASCSITNLDAR